MREKKRNNDFLLVLLLIAIGFLIRYILMPHYLGGWDSVDFALGLNEYNISKYQPHPPGYPVYMLFAKLLFLVFKEDVYSLKLTSSIFGALTILPLYCLAHHMYGRREALLASILLLINPLHWLMSTRALSDITGLFFIMLSVFLLYKATIMRVEKQKLKYLVIASLILGTGLGVRLSYFPHLLLWGFVVVVCFNQVTARNEKRKILLYPFLALIGSILCWVVGQGYVLGYENLIACVISFAKGHFMEWGGTIFTHPNIMGRIKELFIQDIFIHGLGAGGGFLRVLVTLTTSISIFFYLYRERLDYAASLTINFRNKFLMYWFFPYTIWVFLGQNLNNPRHVLVCIPILILMIARGTIYIVDSFAMFTKRVKLPYAFIITLLSSLSFISFNLAIANSMEKSSMVKLVEYVKGEWEPAKTIIFCWESKRIFDYYAPEYITIRDNSANIEESIAFYSYGEPEVILITSDMIEQWRLKGEKLDAQLSLVKRFHHNPYIENSYNTILLYRLEI